MFLEGAEVKAEFIFFGNAVDETDAFVYINVFMYMNII